MENKKLDNHIIITDEDGVEQRFEILFTYDNEDKNISYVLFYDEAKPEEVMAMRFDEQGNLYEIETDEEWDEVEEVLNTFSSEHECECGFHEDGECCHHDEGECCHKHEKNHECKHHKNN